MGLIEHQSTINPNKSIESKTMYSKKTVSIPYPEFFVLYDGKEPFPDKAVYKLSDLFRKTDGFGLPEKPYPLLEAEGIKKAIKYCSRYGILRESLYMKLPVWK